MHDLEMVNPLGQIVQGGAVLAPGVREQQACRTYGEQLDEGVFKKLR